MRPPLNMIPTWNDRTRQLKVDPGFGVVIPAEPIAAHHAFTAPHEAVWRVVGVEVEFQRLCCRQARGWRIDPNIIKKVVCGGRSHRPIEQRIRIAWPGKVQLQSMTVLYVLGLC